VNPRFDALLGEFARQARRGLPDPVEFGTATTIAGHQGWVNDDVTVPNPDNPKLSDGVQAEVGVAIPVGNGTFEEVVVTGSRGSTDELVRILAKGLSS
jgi:hypothetical protein